MNLDEINQRLQFILSYAKKSDWGDSHENPVSFACVENVQRVLRHFPDSAADPIDVMPLASGEIELSWKVLDETGKSEWAYLTVGDDVYQLDYPHGTPKTYRNEIHAISRSPDALIALVT